MLIIPGLALLLSAVMLLMPDSVIGRALRSALIEAPARALNRLGWGKVVFFALLAVAGLTLGLLFEGEGLRLFGLMLPDLMVWFAVFDVGVFIDALLIAGAILSAKGLSAVRAQVAVLPQTISHLVARYAARARRPRRTRPRPMGESSDDDRPGWAYQAAGYRALSMA